MTADADAMADAGKESGRFEELAAAVAGGQTIRAAAAELGIPERTAYRTSGTEEFKSRVAALRSEMACQAVGTLTEACTRAAQTLAEMLSDDNEPKDRLAAARLILSNVGPLAEHSELRARLDKLEKSR